MEMIERVAVALSVADGFHPEATSNDGEDQPAWTLYVAMAKAAIEAMKVPTDEMVAAGEENINGTEDVSYVFTAMIEAALKEKVG